MVTKIIKKISKGSRFNQIYLKKNEGIEFQPGKAVIIKSVLEEPESNIFEYRVTLSNIKKQIVKSIFGIIDDNCSYDNILITGSFLEKGFNFNDIDIIIINPKNTDKVKELITENIGIKPHLILIDSKSLNKGIKRDPLFRLMIDRYVSIKRTLFRRDKEIDYKLIDIYLVRNKNLIDGFDLLNIGQRKKMLRDFVGLKLFAENKEITIKGIEKETERIFGKDIIEKLFYYADSKAKEAFMVKLKKEFSYLEKEVLKNVSK
jgi:hypothetical protein